ncbi:hypothetical protein HON86_00660, partial [Candidatus Woesearchaeota archaeon]|nr:hypothetical protein [Candidatus Woesearchaeota archaeon]
VYYVDFEVPNSVLGIHNAWKKNLEWKSISDHVVDESLQPILNDVISFEDDPFSRDFSKEEYNAKNFVRSTPYGALPTDTSLYMIGDVSVSVILPESISGSEDWTSEEIANVHAEIMNGLDWWVTNNPDADLTFLYDWNDQASTTYEPIELDSIYRHYWGSEILFEMGYGDGTPGITDAMYDFINDQRVLKNTDWGFSIFVVDSSSDYDGKFADNKSAFAILNPTGGGPYLVMTYDNGLYGIDNMDAVVAHETGHIFGAIDQYGSCDCTTDVGYLNYENQNCVNDCEINEDSIMKTITFPFANNLIDQYAKGQIGWIDSDADGILDIVDFEPSVSSFFSGEVNGHFSILGDSSSQVYFSPNSYYSDVSINKIMDVEYNLNEGDWISGFAIDGLFDSFDEQYNVTHNEIFDWGDYLFKVRAQDRFGGVTDLSNYVEINYQSMGCTDSDIENDEKVKGFVLNYDGVFGDEEDQCIGRINLRQYSCNVNDIVYQDLNCTYGCGNGICLNKTIIYPAFFNAPISER